MHFSNFYLPKQLEEYRKQLECSILKSNIFLPLENKTSLLDSKLAGNPYLPKTHHYPKDIEGRFMKLLAQINFSQLDSAPPSFPKSGILQFFISDALRPEKIQEHIFQHYFKVRFFPTVVKKGGIIDNFYFLDYEDWIYFPIKNEMSLSFETILEPVSATDYRLHQFFNIPQLESTFQNNEGRTLEDIYIEYFLAADSKIGGYPYFIESDTRANSKFLKKYDTLLLQIISNDAHGIMWGDLGVLKFFINHKNLQERDFSDIYFILEQY